MPATGEGGKPPPTMICSRVSVPLRLVALR
jgi:hypothetical protein